jgi:hypothetical protein
MGARMTDNELIMAAQRKRVIIVGGHGKRVMYRPDAQEKYPWRDRHGRYWPAWMCFPRLVREQHA